MKAMNETKKLEYILAGLRPGEGEGEGEARAIGEIRRREMYDLARSS